MKDMTMLVFQKLEIFTDASIMKLGLEAAALLLFGISFIILFCKIKKRIRLRIWLCEKDISFIKPLFMLMIEAIVILSCIDKAYGMYYAVQAEQHIEEMRTVVSNEKTVIHAAGTYKIGDAVYTYSNSKEALENCYNSGNTIAELDFVWTSDGKLVCGHDSDEQWCYGIESHSALSEEEFLKCKLFNALTTMSLDDLAEFLREHEKLIIVTDIKDKNISGCMYIADNYPDLIDRFIVQIYHIDEYDAVRALGFKYMIYTLYKTEPDERESEKLVADIRSHDLVGITFWYDWIETKDIYVSIKDIGIPIFVHTVNDRDEIDNCMAMNLLIYTDNIDNEWLR